MMDGTNETKNSVELEEHILKEIANWDFHCDASDLVVVEKGLCNLSIDLWVIKEVDTDITAYRDLMTSYSNIARVYYSKKWNVAEVEIRRPRDSYRSGMPDTELVRTYYVIRIR